MEITTCEQYVLAELEASQAENEALRGRIAELEREKCEAEAKKACTGQHFPAYRSQELERFGLDLLKKRLLEYADKLDEEAEKTEGDE